MTAAALAGARSDRWASLALLLVGFAIVSLAATGGPVPVVVVGAAVVAASLHRILLSWPFLTVSLVVVVLLVPARAYRLPVELPYDLEPYRVLLLVLAGCVVIARTLRALPPAGRPRFSLVVGALLVVAVVSAGANASRIVERGRVADVAGALLSLVLVLSAFWCVHAVLRSPADVHRIVEAFVGVGVVVAVLAVVEQRTGWNAFHHVDRVLPLQPLGEPTVRAREGVIRAAASAQHPLALSVELALLVPVAVYLAARGRVPSDPRARQIVWTVAAVALVAGVAASASRTGIVALAVVAVCGITLRPRLAAVAAALAPPALLLAAIAAPGTVSAVASSFRPDSGLLAEQRASAGGYGSGRLADVAPAFEAIAERPLFGLGFGTRRTDEDDADFDTPPILDNEYLSLAIDAGVPGAAAALALAVLPVAVMWRAARGGGPHSDLAAALACCFAAYATTLLLYDGFAFFQPFLTFLVLLACGSWLVRAERDEARPPSPAGPPQRAAPSLVSVILPARNAARVLPQQLDALVRQTYSGPWEVVVADHESSDDSATIAGAYSGRLPLRIVTVRGARGPGGARNAAARVARGDLLLFCDADDVVCADWVESMARGAPEVDIVGGRLDEETLNSAAVRAWRPPQQPEATLARPDGFLPFAPSCNMAIWADAFWSLGGFSERETHEDVELSWRAQLAGFRIGFAPDAVVAYRHRSSLRELARQSYRYGRGSVALYVQYRERGLRRERLRVVLGSWRRLVTRIPVRSDASSRGAYVRDASFRLGRLVGSLRHRVGYL